MSRNLSIRFLSTVLVAMALLQTSVTGSVLAATDAVPPVADKFTDWNVVGPEGGDVRVVAIDPRDKDRLYVSTLDGQIHTSSDGGRGWRLLVNLNEPELVIDNLMVDSRDSKLIYASGHRHTAPGGFFRSTDAGATWKEAKELKNESIHSLTQSPKDPSILLAGTTSGVWQSKDSGSNWAKVQSPTMPVNIDALAMDPRNTSTLYAGTWWRAYKSTDSGQSWRLIKDGMIDDSDVFAVTLDPRNPDHLIASACSGIYESVNGGEKWAKIQGIPSQSRRTRDILQHPTIAGTVYAATTEGFWMSVNGGKSWMLTTQRNLEINSIAVHPEAPNRVFIGTNNYGVMVSDDAGRNFRATNTNFTSRLTYFVTPDLQQANRLYAGTQNTATGGGYFFVSNDAGRTWKQGLGLDTGRIRPFVVKQDTANPNLIYLGTNAGIYRSMDRGNSWTAITAPKPVGKKPVPKKPVKKTGSVTVAAPPVGPLVIPALTAKVQVIETIPGVPGGLLAATDSGLFRTTSLAKGWTKVDLGPGISNNIFAVHIAAARPDTIWVGTSTTGVVVSRDGGQTWSRVRGAVNSVPISSIATDPKRPDFIYVGTIQTFYVSKDNGQSWTRRGGNLPVGNYTSILINPDNTDEIFLSNALDSVGGVYMSTDAGNKWKRVDAKDLNLPTRRIWSMAFDPQNPNRLYAATHSSGVYRIERTSGSAVTATGTGDTKTVNQ